MSENSETRQERREKKLKKKRERIRQHGKNLAQVYRDAIMKRLKGK
jgi:ribosomal protein L25 (general stress protein Ctc)